MCDRCGVLGEPLNVGDYWCPECLAFLEDPQNPIRFVFNGEVVEVWVNRWTDDS